jgi:hypothetical protein
MASCCLDFPGGSPLLELYGILWAKFLFLYLLKFLLDGQVWLVSAGDIENLQNGEPTEVVLLFSG